MVEKKKISCRVCEKKFEPCSTCQSQGDMFRWRNFACSLKCAEKYINDTISYREALKNEKIPPEKVEKHVINYENSEQKDITIRKKGHKKNLLEFTETATDYVKTNDNETE